MTDTQARRWLVILLAGFLLAGALYSAATPLFESPDASSHLQVIDYLARERRLYPPGDPERVTTGPAMAAAVRYHTPPRYYTPPLYHALGALLTSATGIEMTDLEARLIPNPAWALGWAPQRDADPWNKNVFAHLPGETWQASPTMRATLLLRALSLLLGAMTLALTYAIGREIAPERPALALSAAAWVGLNPQVIALSAGVTNDPLLNALFALSLLLALRGMRQAASWRYWAALGGVIGVGMLTKQSALLLLPLGGLAILGSEHTRATRWLTSGLAMGITAALVGGGWYLRNALRYGDPLGLAPHFDSQVALASFGLPEIIAVFETYWVGLGWALISAPGWVYHVIGGAVLIALAGWARALLPGGDFWRAPAITRRSLGLLAAALTLNALSLTRWAASTGAPYGRLLFPTAAATGVLLAWGWGQWRDLPGFAQFTHALAVAAALGALLVPRLLLRPAFASPIHTEALPARVHPLEVTFANDVALLGIDVPEGDLRPGEHVTLELYWHAARPPGEQLTPFIQIAPQDATQRIAANHHWLGGTLYPSDLWQADTTIRQSHTLALPQDAPAPRLYWIRLGLLDAEGTPIPQTQGDENALVLGPWRMRASTPPPPPRHHATHQVGPAITFHGCDAAIVRDSLALTLTWSARAEPATDYAVFVHLLDADGELIGQHDGPPDRGNYPTSWWRSGDIVRDPHVLPLPADLATARLRVGLYDPATGQRLDVLDAQGNRLPTASISFATASCLSNLPE